MPRKIAQRHLTKIIYRLVACGLTLTAPAIWMNGEGLASAFATLFAALGFMAASLRD